MTGTLRLRCNQVQLPPEVQSQQQPPMKQTKQGSQPLAGGCLQPKALLGLGGKGLPQRRSSSGSIMSEYRNKLGLHRGRSKTRSSSPAPVLCETATRGSQPLPDNFCQAPASALQDEALLSAAPAPPLKTAAAAAVEPKHASMAAPCRAGRGSGTHAQQEGHDVDMAAAASRDAVADVPQVLKLGEAAGAPAQAPAPAPCEAVTVAAASPLLLPVPPANALEAEEPRGVATASPAGRCMPGPSAAPRLPTRRPSLRIMTSPARSSPATSSACAGAPLAPVVPLRVISPATAAAVGAQSAPLPVVPLRARPPDRPAAAAYIGAQPVPLAMLLPVPQGRSPAEQPENVTQEPALAGEQQEARAAQPRNPASQLGRNFQQDLRTAVQESAVASQLACKQSIAVQGRLQIVGSLTQAGMGGSWWQPNGSVQARPIVNGIAGAEVQDAQSDSETARIGNASRRVRSAAAGTAIAAEALTADGRTALGATAAHEDAAAAGATAAAGRAETAYAQPLAGTGPRRSFGETLRSAAASSPAASRSASPSPRPALEAPFLATAALDCARAASEPLVLESPESESAPPPGVGRCSSVPPDFRCSAHTAWLAYVDVDALRAAAPSGVRPAATETRLDKAAAEQDRLQSAAEGEEVQGAKGACTRDADAAAAPVPAENTLKAQPKQRHRLSRSSADGGGTAADAAGAAHVPATAGSPPAVRTQLSTLLPKPITLPRPSGALLL